ncbi:MAG TPA: ABC transporter ATP-binding protein [Burkholderiales bacterium]|nr:ABC transporter ATP-binding protein [Burkholderiales bacterium]
MLKVEQLCTEYTDERGRVVKAAQDVSFDVPTGKFFTLLGPSGCGKTTTLRSIAGLERPTSGEITVDGALVYSSAGRVFVAPNKRKFGMVFQSYAIWPHMNVFQNAAFPLEVGHAQANRREIRDKVMRVLDTVGLAELADREATALSGGQQQRLALARALVMEPRLLLLDEPLSNLDAKLRERMRFELKRLQNELGITTIYVTHDQSEALALSHEIAVMGEGRIVQIGAPRDIYDRPCNKFVADFVGTTNFIEATVLARENGADEYRLQCAIGELVARSVRPLARGDSALLSIRPEDIELSAHKPHGANVCEGTVQAKVFLGEYLDFEVSVAERVLLARVHPSVDCAVGQRTFLQMRPEKCVAINQS